MCFIWFDQQFKLNFLQQLGPEQAALAQSQHFDQLEALWNKRSPPRRRLMLSKQNSRQSDPPTPLEEDPGGLSDD